MQDILEMLASGMTADEVVAEYVYLELEDVRAALAYAANTLADTAVVAA